MKTGKAEYFFITFVSFGKFKIISSAKVFSSLQPIRNTRIKTKENVFINGFSQRY